MNQEDWLKKAACRGVALTDGFDDFFPREEKLPGDKKRRPAAEGKKKYCTICAVREECLDYAIRNSIEDGIWGGEVLQERKHIGRDYRKDFDNLVSELEPSMREVLKQIEGEMQGLQRLL